MTIGKYIIKKQGVAYNIVNTEKKGKEVNSYSYLKHAIQRITHFGNKVDKEVAKVILDLLNAKLEGIRVIDNDKYMVEYRELENDFFGNFK